jgi:hypothetical protein
VGTSVRPETIRLAPIPGRNEDVTEHREFRRALYEYEQSGRQGEPPVPPESFRRPWVLPPLLGAWWIPTPLSVIFDDPQRPVIAQLDIVTGPDARPRPVRVEITVRDGVDEVSPESVRIPIAEIVRMAVRLYRWEGPDVEPGSAQTRGQLFQVSETVGPQVRIPRKRVARSEDRLRRVAEIYEAAEWGERAKKVAEELNVAQNTARNLISQARNSGFLDKRGEADKKES